MVNTNSIPNERLEEMFLRVASDEQIQKYFVLTEARKNAPATTMATRTVYKLFMSWADQMVPVI